MFQYLAERKNNQSNECVIEIDEDLLPLVDIWNRHYFDD